MSVLLLTIDLHLSMVERQEKVTAALSSPSMEFIVVIESDADESILNADQRREMFVKNKLEDVEPSSASQSTLCESFSLQRASSFE